MLAVDEGLVVVGQGPEAPASAVLQGQGLAAVECAAIDEWAAEFEAAMALGLEVAAVRQVALKGERERAFGVQRRAVDERARMQFDVPAREVCAALKGERGGGLQMQRALALNTGVQGRDCAGGQPYLTPGAERLGAGGGSVQVYLIRLDVKRAARGHPRLVAQLNRLSGAQVQVALGIEGVLDFYIRMVGGRQQVFRSPRPVEQQLSISRDA